MVEISPSLLNDDDVEDDDDDDGSLPPLSVLLLLLLSCPSARSLCAGSGRWEGWAGGDRMVMVELREPTGPRGHVDSAKEEYPPPSTGRSHLAFEPLLNSWHGDVDCEKVMC